LSPVKCRYTILAKLVSIMNSFLHTSFLPLQLISESEKGTHCSVMTSLDTMYNPSRFNNSCDANNHSLYPFFLLTLPV